MSDPIVIVDYHPDWPGRFRALGAQLRGALGPVALRIDHIGSTAVPGLAAKPIIDVQVSVASFEPLDAIRAPLEALGWVYRGDNPDLAKRYFREAPGTRRTHLHVRLLGSWAEQHALLFRDYLRAHPDNAARYAAVKRALARRYRADRHAYTEGKGEIIWEITARAHAWHMAMGWVAGPSDA